MPKTQKRIKAFACVDPLDQSIDWHAGQLMISMSKTQAQLDCFQGSKVVPCTIIYNSPQGKK